MHPLNSLLIYFIVSISDQSINKRYHSALTLDFQQIMARIGHAVENKKCPWHNGGQGQVNNIITGSIDVLLFGGTDSNHKRIRCIFRHGGCSV
jgi:hypothetical protein